jgi:hypothetical protein
MRFWFRNDVILVERSVVDISLGREDRRQAIAASHEGLVFPAFSLVNRTLHDAERHAQRCV